MVVFPIPDTVGFISLQKALDLANETSWVQPNARTNYKDAPYYQSPTVSMPCSKLGIISISVSRMLQVFRGSFPSTVSRNLYPTAVRPRAESHASNGSSHEVVTPGLNTVIIGHCQWSHAQEWEVRREPCGSPTPGRDPVSQDDRAAGTDRGYRCHGPGCTNGRPVPCMLHLRVRGRDMHVGGSC